MKSTALPRWKYGDPSNIADGLIAESKRADERKSKQLEMQLKSNRRRIKALVKKTKKGGFKWK